jgi:hypothetical protein
MSDVANALEGPLAIDLRDVYSDEHAVELRRRLDGVRHLARLIFTREFLEKGIARRDDVVGEPDVPTRSAYQFRKKLVEHLVDAGDLTLEGDRLSPAPGFADRLERGSALLAELRSCPDTLSVDLYAQIAEVASEVLAGRDGFEAVAERQGFSKSLAQWEDLMVRQHAKRPCNALLVRVLTRLMAGPRPIRVFEGGAGVGAVLRTALADDSFARSLAMLERYYFTDISPLLLQVGKERVLAGPGKALAGRVAFEVCDLDQLATSSADYARPGAVDLILLEHVLYDVRRLSDTLRVMRGMLRDGGVLAFTMSFRQRPGVFFPCEFVQSTLHSYYRAELEPGLRESPGYLSCREWKAILDAAGFHQLRVYPDESELERFPFGGIVAVRS